jgi:hypothetical protein
VARIDIQRDNLVITLTKTNGLASPRRRNVLKTPWQKTPSRRRREILLPASVSAQAARPIRSETSSTLIASIARGRLWLQELISDANASAERIAKRERCSIRQVNMTVSLAFTAQGLVKAAIEGRLPRGIGVTRLRDAPPEWSRQHAMLGLASLN